ncbi:hypothetical protein K469DRAFT_570418 [Zopfia rhizophila CBS 207.26]|uniref:Uncharacterized protein n=1 Tax=Zopfia rhizophila CBS 207.26 TaxID=1314779 RepID=A0A6A6E618_9PEZI|nr:hypothetical protein K469DRAFT_570418 [Zopfia rhizophila CBS 207.26]
MHFLPNTRKPEPGKLPMQEPKSPVMENRSDSRTSQPKPLPTRTISTRVQEPARNTSQVKRSESTYTKHNRQAERLGLQRRRTTAQTKYIDMLLNLDQIPRLHNILASFFTWILLAGYIVFPATFNSIKKNNDLDEKANSNLETQALVTVRNAPLLYVAAFACGIGIAGCVWLWWAHRGNYVWVINRIFLPAFMNSIAGLISTIVNIYSAQSGKRPRQPH